MFIAKTMTDDMVRTAAEGAADQREQLLGQLAPQVRAMVVSRLSPTPAQFPAVEDLTQQSLLAVSAGLTRLRHRTVAALKSFASVVVARKVADFIRRAGTPVRSLDSTAPGASSSVPLWTVLSIGGPTPASAVANAEQIELVIGQMGGLRPRHREVILLAFFDQLPIPEIAQRMGLSGPATSMLLWRAMGTLRRNTTGSSRIRSGRGRAS